MQPVSHYNSSATSDILPDVSLVRASLLILGIRGLIMSLITGLL